MKSIAKRRVLAAAVALTLLCTLIPGNVFSATKAVTHYRLDTGVIFIWKHSGGTWQSGWAPGGNTSYSRVHTLPTKARGVEVNPYNGSNFKFDNQEIYHWNVTAYANNKGEYDKEYYDYAASPLTVSGANSYSAAAGNISVTYNLTFNPKGGTKFDVKDALANNRKDEITARLGSPTQDEIGAMNLMTPGHENYSSNVEGYLFFLPIVFKYTVDEDIPDDIFDAILDLPASAGVGETYTAKDISEIGGDLTIRAAELAKRDKGAAVWSPVVTWPGGGKGQNSGGKKDEKAAKPGEIEYLFTVTAEDGRTDTDVKTVKILEEDEEAPDEEENAEEDADIGLDAVLELPSAVYEGHNALASDRSMYTVDDASYSAERMYEEHRAVNSFSASNDSGASVNRETWTTAETTWPKLGNYSVTLRISAGGSSDTDTRSIEVLKTPAIIDVLGGKQKQNRKQTLTASIATNPLHPIVEAWMELTEKNTGETVRLTMDGALKNSDNIKTRAIAKDTENSDKYYTVLELSFLTKWGSEREMSYTIYARDARGQTDEVSKDFTVIPDLAPNPEILLPTEFLRNKGTNTARIETEDRSTADSGDQLERTWYASAPAGLPGASGAFASAKNIPGFEDMSFGSGVRVAFDKTGVGPASVKIHVKDVWTDETLPEYITNADYLTAESEVSETVVHNVAPVVSLSPKDAKSADILLLAASKTEYDNMLARKNELDRHFIEAGIDAKLMIKRLSEPTGFGFPATMSLNLPYSSLTANFAGRPAGTLLSVASATALDDDTFYVIRGTWKVGLGVDGPYYLEAYDARSGVMKWSYTINESATGTFRTGELFEKGVGFGHDDEGKYLYLRYTDKTYLFDKAGGAYQTKINFAFGEYNYIANNAVYTLAENGVYRYRSSGGAPERLFTGNITGESRLFGGKARFFAQTAPNAYMADFDLATEKVTLVRLAGVTADVTKNKCRGIDAEGNLLLITETDTFLYDKNGRVVKELRGVGSGGKSTIAIKNRAGKITHTAVFSIYRGSSDSETLTVYGLYSGKVFTDTRSVRETHSPYLLYGIEEDDNILAVQLGLQTNDLGNGWGQSENHFHSDPGWYSVNTATGAIAFRARYDHLAYLDGHAEYAVASDSLYAVGWGADTSNDPPPANDTGISVKTLPQTEDDILSRITFGSLTNESKDIKAAVLLDDSGVKFGANGGGFRSALGGSTFVKLSNSSSVNLAESVISSITAPGYSPYKALLVQKSAGADASSISRSFKLDPSRTYYYEYEAKLPSGAEGADKYGTQPLTIDVETAKAVPDARLAAEKLYVQKLWFEDFNGGPLAGFFKLDSKNIANGGYITTAICPPRTSGAYQVQSNITFTVPEGNRAVLSFDYASSALTARESYMLVDGEIWLEAGTYNASGSYTPYTHPNLLGSGDHTVTSVARTTNGSRSLIIDNLKVELLNDAPREISYSDAAKSSGDGGWTRYSGSFETPAAAIVYESQPLEVYEGPASDNPLVTAQNGESSYSRSMVVNLPAGKFAVQSAVEPKRTAYDRGNTGHSLSDERYASNGVTYWFHNYVYHSSYIQYAVGNIPFGYPGAAVAEAVGLSKSTAAPIDFFGKLYLYLIDEINAPIAEGHYTLDKAAGRVYFANHTFTGVNMRFSGENSDEWRVRDFQIHYLENGLKVYVTRDNMSAANEAALWNATGGNMALVDERPADAEEEEEGALLYKKGELVLYNIGYTDYENDPSGASFWRYTHTPFNDGPHPDAAVIKNLKGEVTGIADKTLSANIDRFYIDGKYTVEHWQQDNTNRTNDASGRVHYNDFNKYSNTESLTFYIEGGGEAPWVTSVKTNPSPVREGDAYTIIARVDDKEKDTLTAVIEVYLENKEVYRYYEENIDADADGNYPPVVTGLAPNAFPGNYTVVVTVSDEDGVGIGNYKFTVLVEGKIEGAVYHTDQWEKNRKSYNRNLFSDEINRVTPYTSYKLLPAPRARGVNVFWSGERFMLKADVGGSPNSVTCQIAGYPAYITNMSNTGAKNDDDFIYGGSLWDSSMVNKWGKTSPAELTFVFTAHYEGGITKTHEATVIVDTYEDYWQLHRNF